MFEQKFVVVVLRKKMSLGCLALLSIILFRPWTISNCNFKLRIVKKYSARKDILLLHPTLFYKFAGNQTRASHLSGHITNLRAILWPMIGLFFRQ